MMVFAHNFHGEFLVAKCEPFQVVVAHDRRNASENYICTKTPLVIPCKLSKTRQCQVFKYDRSIIQWN